MDQQKKTNEYLAEAEETYQTGTTQPPKSHGGLIAMLFGLVILLCGLTTALSLMNIRMFWQLNAPEQSSKEIALSFTRDTAPAVTVPQPTPVAPAVTQPDLELVLDTVPQDILPEPPQESELALQEPSNQALEPEPVVPEFPLEDVRSCLQPSLVKVTCTLSEETFQGTGLVLSSDGYLLTGSAGLEDTAVIQVRLANDRQLDALLIGKDELTGLAVLQVQATDLIPAAFCDSACLTEGQQIAALPSGNVSEVVHVLPGLLQTNTSTAAGEPLVNAFGQVVAVSAGSSGMPQDLSQALGFAIPSSSVKEVAERLIREYEPEEDASLGMIGQAIPLFYQLYYELPEGFYITSVDGASDAFLKGISIGDILISINGQSLESITDLSEAVGDFKPGDSVSVVVYRSGQHYELIITLGEE